MPEPLRSSLWYRVAELKPRLRSHAKLHRHHYRGQVWYLLRDPGSGRVNRFTPAARLVISLMDGKRTVATLWDIANRRLGEDAPTQDEMIRLLDQLNAADLLQSDVTPDAADLSARGARDRQSRQRRSFSNPMAIRVPLWDPDRFLNRFPKTIAAIWSRWGALVWLAVVLPAAILVPMHWPELSNNFSDRVLSLDNIAVLYVVFPLLKFCHEMGHATATKARGGEVHDLGLIVLVLLPVPYVEASAATTFRSKYQRAIVGAGGVIVELFIAALAFYLWLAIEPGSVRAVLYNVMVIAGVSTLVFNGNPLMRYDAYYILADLIEVPNLAARSLRYWSYLLERYVLGVPELEPPDADRAEKAWLFFYGAVSTVYRILVTVFIALFIAGRFYFVGVLLAAWAVIAMAVLPLARGARHLFSSPRLRANRPRAIGAAVALLGLIAAFVLFVPIPDHTHAEGVIWMPDESLVRAGGNGFVSEFLTTSGTRVTRGDPLIRCTDPELTAKLRAAEAVVAEAEATYMIQVAVDRTKAAVMLEKVRAEQARLDELRRRAVDLTVRANTDGVFIVPRMDDQIGRFHHQGELLGYVIGTAPPLARVVVPQDAVDQVRLGSDRVRLRRIDEPGTILTGAIVRAIPGGDELLPSAALAVDGGGEIATDPRNTKGPQALRRMFQLDVRIDTEEPISAFGQRVLVRFEHTGAPLSVQWYRAVRLLFLSRFGV
jgi:putative peptide zinc metalloprotease protein